MKFVVMLLDLHGAEIARAGVEAADHREALKLARDNYPLMVPRDAPATAVFAIRLSAAGEEVEPEPAGKAPGGEAVDGEPGAGNEVEEKMDHDRAHRMMVETRR